MLPARGTQSKPGHNTWVFLLVLLMVTFIACTSTSSSPEPSTELVQMAIALRNQAKEGQWDQLKQALVPEFQSYDGETLRRALHAGRSITDGWPIPEGDEWEVEPYSSFTVVRVKDIPPLALVFRKDPQGAWKLDPGIHSLVIAERIKKGISDYLAAHPAYERIVEPQATSPREAARRLDLTIESVYLRGRDVYVNVLAASNYGEAYRIALQDISWSAGDRQGPVEVHWTQSQLEDGDVVFPGAPVEQRGTAYLITFLLKNVPEVDTIEIRYNNVNSEADTFSVTHRFPRKSTTD